MLCIRPYRAPHGEFPCGGCLPCRVNRRRMWTCRIVLESNGHEHNSFLTLTYADIPRGGYGPPAPYVISLNAQHLSLFWKRLRAAVPVRLRYFAVGEYGDQSGRAHFHAAVFGLPSTAGQIVQRCWDFGSVHLGTLTVESAQYVAGYVCKKMITQKDLHGCGRTPEFARMSQGIGRGAIGAIAASWSASSALDTEGDVPAAVRINGSILPLGQYVRRKMRERVGREANMPQDVRQRLAVEFHLEDKALKERRRENNYLSLRDRLLIGHSKRKL